MELLLTFVVPILFFSVFALIFSGSVGGKNTPTIKVVAVDERQDSTSAALLADLREIAGFKFVRDAIEPSPSRPDAITMVRRGVIGIAIVITDATDTLKIELLADTSDQVAGQIALALVSRVVATAALPTHRSLVDQGTRQNLTFPAAVSPVELVDILGEEKTNPVVSMYAAGIAVMFLLFGATNGGGALIEERENQTLDRLLASRLTMDELLIGKWLYLTAIGFLQVCVMFIWGQLVFNVDVWGHWDGFLMMSLVTASAAAGLGLCMATLCRTRGQLNGVSVVLVLTMSALGGSMVPRYVMSPELRAIGQWTFNAWALDGYDKVFWRELPITELWPQLTVLMFTGVVLLVLARIGALRWES
jgi:ABC-2 type transport system permease protein